MCRKFYLILMVLVAALQLKAVTVNSTAGKLSTVVTDHSITSLTITGSIDARDFKFIAENLEKLKSLDISGVKIRAYTSSPDDQLLSINPRHEANALPYCALAGLTSLQTLKLPGNLRAIDYGALAGCTALSNVTIPWLVEKIGDDAFNSCTSLTEVTIGGHVTYLGQRAFMHCHNLAAVNFYPNSPLEIGDEAFADCPKLTNMNVGENVTKIGNGAFEGCTSLNVVYFLNGSQLEDVGDRAFYNTGIKNFKFERTPNLKHLGAWALARTKLTKISIPAHVKLLDEGVLFYNNALTTIELPQTLTYLPHYMLAGCHNVDAGFMTQRMSNIGDFALYNQSQHTAITLPYTVTSIGTQAMAGMIGLQEITSLPIEPPALGDDVWLGIDQSKVKLNVSNECLNDYQAALQWANFLTGVVELRGDVNNDGVVNTTDAIAERQLIVDGNNQDVIASRTDVNGDERVNVGDIVSIYNIINDTEPTGKPYRTYFDDAIEGYGSSSSTTTIELNILLTNSRDYSAFQFNISTPSYITITDAQLSNDRCLGHEVHLGNASAGHYTIAAFSPVGENIDGNSGMLLKLYLTSAQHININNNDFITLDDILFADLNEVVYKRSGLKINLLGNSAIDNITVDAQNDLPVDVYNTQGQLLRRGVQPDQATQGLPQGIYIVGGKKVIVR